MAYRWQHILIAALILLHWGIIVLHNGASLLASRGRPIASLQQLLRSAPLAGYAFYSGTATAYGFFAPAVGSNYTLHVSLYDRQGRLLRDGTNAGLRSLEGRLRYQAFLDVFSELLPTANMPAGRQCGAVEARYARAVVRSVGSRLAARYGAATVRCRIALYRQPMLRAATADSSASPIILYETTFTNPAADEPLPVLLRR